MDPFTATYITRPQASFLPINGLLDVQFRLLSHSLICLCRPRFIGQGKSNKQMVI